MLRAVLVGLLAVGLIVSCGGSVDDKGAGGSTGGNAGSAGKGGSATGGSGGVGAGAVGGSAGVAGSGAVGGSGGVAGSGGTSGEGGSAGMPSQCQIEPGYPGPYPTEFQFVNQSTAPVWLSHVCALRFEVNSCADNYAAAISMDAPCSSGCDQLADGGGCLACGPCQPQIIEVKPGDGYKILWSGFEYTFEQTQGCTCHVEHVASAGKYRVKIPVWDAAFDPMQGTTPPASRTAQLDFGIPSKGPIMVSIGK